VPVLAHDVSGSGPAVVFLHAGIADRRMWEPQTGAFVDAGYRVVRSRGRVSFLVRNPGGEESRLALRLGAALERSCIKVVAFVVR
jgi:hypothetical protein